VSAAPKTLDTRKRIEGRGSRIEDRVITNRRSSIFNPRSSILFRVFAFLKRNSISRGPRLLLTVYKEKGIFPPEYLEKPPRGVEAP
jgi:hypothetical protein